MRLRLPKPPDDLPTKGRGGAKSGEAYAQLRDYAKRVGGVALDSSAGFAIGPGRAVKSPDASWVSARRVAALPSEEAEEFWPLSPDVTIEVKSGDSWETTVAKAGEYIERGTAYSVAIDPETREIVELGAKPEALTLDFDAIIDA